MQKGIKLLQDTKEITQFFNRDSSDALQTTADAALTKFLDKPDDVSRSSRTGRPPPSRSGTHDHRGVPMSTEAPTRAAPTGRPGTPGPGGRRGFRPTLGHPPGARGLGASRRAAAHRARLGLLARAQQLPALVHPLERGRRRRAGRLKNYQTLLTDPIFRPRS